MKSIGSSSVWAGPTQRVSAALAACLFAMAALVAFCPLAFADDGGELETDAPVLDTIVVDKTEATAGDTVTFTLTARDASGLDLAESYLNLRGPFYSEFPQIVATGQDTYTASVRIIQGWIDGQYQVESIRLTDVHGNHLYARGSAYGSPGFSVSGCVADADAPELASVAADKSDATAGDTVTFSIDAQDESGIDLQRSELYLKGPNDGLFANLSRTTDGNLVATVTVGAGWVDGVYTVSSVWLWDVNGCYKSYYSRDFGNVSFTVTGCVSDTDAPALLSVSADRSVVILGETVTFTVAYADESDINTEDCYLYLRCPSGSEFLYFKKMDSVLSASFVVAEEYGLGAYRVENVRLADVHGNYASYRSSDFGTVGFSAVTREESEDHAAADAISTLVDKAKETMSEEDIAAAEIAFFGLTELQQSLVPHESLIALVNARGRLTAERVAAEQRANEASAARVAELIDKAAASGSRADVSAAEAAFANLTEVQRGLVGSDKLEQLVLLRASLEAAAGEDTAGGTNEPSKTVPATADATASASTGKAADKATASANTGRADNKAIASVNTGKAADKATVTVTAAKTAYKATVTVNAKRVTAKVIDTAVAKAGGVAKGVKTVVAGKRVRTISKGAFAKCTKCTTLVVRSTKLTKASVKGCLKSSSLNKVKVPAKKYKAYKKIFAKSTCGKKVRVVKA